MHAIDGNDHSYRAVARVLPLCNLVEGCSVMEKPAASVITYSLKMVTAVSFGTSVTT
jgi:hypothetical protein